MEEIKVGDYVRTVGEIRKIIGYKVGEYIEIYHDRGSCSYWDKDKVIQLKHSKNIIDLIEVGDYVNGKCVIAIDNRINDNGEKVILIENYDEWTDDGVISKKDIKTIVTKEQFESMQYTVKEDRE